MKNHFFFQYTGNKRSEVITIYNQINFNNIHTIVEPFCGSCAISYYIWTLNKDKNYKYILNDIDPHLISLLKLIKDGNYKEVEDDFNKIIKEIYAYEDDMDSAKKIYLEYIKKNNLTAYILSHRHYLLRPALFPIRKQDFKKFYNNLDFTQHPIYDFLTNADIELYNEDAINIIDKYDNENSFMFLDPPYIERDNTNYVKITNKNISNIYETLFYKKISNFKCKMMICHEYNWIFKVLFNDYINEDDKYVKTYAQNIISDVSRKKTFHICAKNYKN
jgi:site-specific DNA-adenine methylase